MLLRAQHPNPKACYVGPLFQGLTLEGCLPDFASPDISHAYDRALQTYEVVLHDLIQSSTTSLWKATTFDALMAFETK